MPAKDSFDPVEPRLMTRFCVDETTGCWNWTRGRSKTGYGVLSVRGKHTKAHRASYEMHRGPIPVGLCVCHRCDNPSCINPNHLFLGTNQDNTADKIAKGRQPKGEAIYRNRKTTYKGEHNGRSKISSLDVRAIRDATGIKQIDLAKQYGISQSQISLIRKGGKGGWQHVD